MGFRDKKTPGNLRVSLEHTEKEKNLLIELKGQMLELKKVILNAEITIENIEKKINLPLPPSKTEHEKLSIYSVPVLTDSITLFINHRGFILEKLGESIDLLKLNTKKSLLSLNLSIFKKN